MRWFKVVLAAVLFPALALAQVRITNLSDKSAYVAHYSYVPYSSNSGGLAVVTEEGWVFSGWWEVEPGDTFRGNDGWYYVSKNQSPITWSNLDKSPGIVKYGPAFNTKVAKSRQAADFQDRVNQGYTRVDFMNFPAGSYQISGNTYRKATKRFNFNEESRSIHFFSERFEVPGKIVTYSVSASSRWEKDITWQLSPNKRVLLLNGSVEGRQTSPFAGRDPGIYSGSVEVEYTVRN